MSSRTTIAGLLLAIAIGVPCASIGQTQYHVTTQEHTTCSTALPFCDDIVYHFDYDVNWDEGFPCIYFVIEIEAGQSTWIDANSNQPGNFKLMVAGPFSEPCPPDTLTCGQQSNPNGSLQTTGPGYYYVWGYFDGHNPGTVNITVSDPVCPEPCDNCLPPFSPQPGEDYIINAWVKETGAPAGTITYTDAWMEVVQPPNTVICTTSAVGHVVDGWQLVEGRFTMPGAGGIELVLRSGTGTALFDDVRLFPADASMKAYVYDPRNLRYMAELDERHYATLYEYDAEGRLVRVKKETERGVMTIQESRQKAPTQNP